MGKISKFLRRLFLSKYHTRKVNRLKSKSNYEPFEYLNKMTNNKRLKKDEDYHDFLIEEGFIDKNHKPLICKKCGNRRFFNCISTWTDIDHSNKEHVEEIRCGNCGESQAAFYFNKWLTS